MNWIQHKYELRKLRKAHTELDEAIDSEQDDEKLNDLIYEVWEIVSRELALMTRYLTGLARKRMVPYPSIPADQEENKPWERPYGLARWCLTVTGDSPRPRGDNHRGDRRTFPHSGYPSDRRSRR